MRSPIGFAASLVLLLAVPVAFASQLVVDESAELILHLTVGAGCVLLAVAMFDFGLSRWVTWIGAGAAGAFGSIFLLQFVSGLVTSDALHALAYGVLGQEIEGVLPYAMLIWFVALLLQGSSGKSRILGWVTISTVIGVEVLAIVGPSVGVQVESQKLLFLLPILWLLFESGKRRTEARPDTLTSEVVDRHPSGSAA